MKEMSDGEFLVLLTSIAFIVFIGIILCKLAIVDSQEFRVERCKTAIEYRETKYTEEYCSAVKLVHNVEKED